MAWFLIDFFRQNLNLIEQARKKSRPQNTNDETVLAEQSDYIRDPEWFMNHLLTSQQIYQVKLFPQSLFTKSLCS